MIDIQKDYFSGGRKELVGSIEAAGAADCSQATFRTTAEQLIEQLGLLNHPEGGWFRETYRSAELIPETAMPKQFGGSRSYCTAIYFLLERTDISALHRIQSDELWHFHTGSAVTIHVLTPEGGHQQLLLGPDLLKGEFFQVVVPAGCWFGAEVSGEGAYALVGCTVAPGFDFADFEMGNRSELLSQYPGQEDIILRLTKPDS